MDDNFGLGYAMGQDSNGSNCNNGGFGGDWSWIWALLILGLLFGNGFGGGFGGGGGMLNGIATRADINAGFQFNDLQNGIRGLQNGLCDGFYAVNTGMLNGFHGVDNGLCTLGYQVQQGFNTLGYQQKDCCCETQRLIERGFCDLGQSINMQTRDIIDNQNANYRGIMDFMVQSKMDALRSENEALRLRASQADQNAVLRAAIDASTAEIIRRTGNDYPTSAYLVQPPTPINFPTNCCGTVQFGGQGYGNNGFGCGCGC